jgi:putative transcriptional regulator
MFTAEQYRAKAAEFNALLANTPRSPNETGEFRKLAQTYATLAENEEWMAVHRDRTVQRRKHGDDGAMGLILNRAAQTTISEAVPELAWLTDASAIVHVGGPVAAQSVVVLAEFLDPSRSALLVEDDLGFVPAEIDDPEELAELLRRARVFAGHAGWGPGQLEGEMQEESWIVGDALREDVFTDDPEDLWSAVLRRKGDKYALMATMPMDPSQN